MKQTVTLLVFLLTMLSSCCNKTSSKLTENNPLDSLVLVDTVQMKTAFLNCIHQFIKQYPKDSTFILKAGYGYEDHGVISNGVYINNDMVGVQLGGAIKNVIAIGAGVSDGMGFGANARTAVITRGLVEISRLGASLGADPKTFMGMAGLGDLVLTCTDNQSRNRRFGLALGQGKKADDIIEEIGQVVEGFYNTKEAYFLAQKQGVEMPIVEQIYQMLFEGKSAVDVAKALLGRERKGE